VTKGSGLAPGEYNAKKTYRCNFPGCTEPDRIGVFSRPPTCRVHPGLMVDLAAAPKPAGTPAATGPAPQSS
jgi:hypothetical protein